MLAGLRLKLGLSVALTLVTLLVYAPVRHHHFLNWDDNEYVVYNPQVQSGMTWTGLKWAVTTFHAANWHPVTWISHMLDCELFGLRPAGHHLSNAVLHAFNGVLFFLLLVKMTNTTWSSLMVAALFSLHPLHVESVSWVAERKDLLSTLFSLITLWFYADWARTRKRLKRLLSISCFALALAAKPMPVTLPFVMLLLDHWPLGRTLLNQQELHWKARLKPLMQRVFEKWPFFALAAASCVITVYAQQAGSAVAPLGLVPLAMRIQNAIISYALYMVKMMWPSGLSPIYPLVLPLSLERTLGSMALLVGISFLVWRFRRLGFMPVGWLWYLGMLVPVIGIVHVGSQSMADRYTYMPLIGLFMMMVWAVRHLFEKWRFSTRSVAVIGLTLLAGIATLTYRQTFVWRDSETLFEYALRVNPRNYVAHNVLGDTLRSENRLPEAIAHFEAALSVNPWYTEALTALGIINAEQGQMEKALDYFRRAVVAEPGSHQSRFNLGEILIKVGRFEDAIEQLKIATLLLPTYARALTSLGVAKTHLGHWQEAEAAHRRALEIDPHFADAWNNLGYVLAMTGRFGEAIEAFGNAVRIWPAFADAMVNWSNALAKRGDLAGAASVLEWGLKAMPENAELHFSLANLLAGQNRFDEAIDHYSQTLRDSPTHALASSNLAHALNRAGRTAEAIKQYQSTLQIDPRLAMAHNNLGLLLLQTGRTDEAFRHLQEALRIDPEYVNAHFNLGLFHTQRGAFSDALMHFEKALSLEPRFAAARFKLGETCLAMGDRAGALREVEQLRSLDPSLADRLSAQID